ncbi:WD40-repeat-containing domain protein [Dipodascopsis uninucleata]
MEDKEEKRAKDSSGKRKRSHKKYDWKLSSGQGGGLLGIPPVFSWDHKYLIVLTSLEVRVYSSKSKQKVASYPVTKAHQYVDLVIDPSDNGNSDDRLPLTWLIGSNGICFLIDWKSVKPHMLNLNEQNIRKVHRVVKILEGGKVFVLAISHGKQYSDISIVRVSVDKEFEPVTLADVKNVNLFALSHSRSHFIFRTSLTNTKSGSSNIPDEIVVGMFPDTTKFMVCALATIERSRKSSTVAVSDSGIVAVGSSTGVIDLYYPMEDDNILDYHHPSSKSYVIRSLKWHLDPVRALAFSLDGNYLLSGGNEKVLLFWQLDTSNIQFLPRLAGPITDIIVDDSSTTYAVCLGNRYDDLVLLAATDLDARLQISSIKATYKNLPPLSLAGPDKTTSETITSASIRQLDFPGKVREARRYISKVLDIGDNAIDDYSIYPSAVHIAPQEPARISKQTLRWYFPTSTGANIQIYNPLKGEESSVLPVARALQLGKVLFEESIVDPQITQMMFSTDGSWMMTVDETQTPPIDSILSEFDIEVSLKFWMFNSEEEGAPWRLTTRLLDPHGANVKVVAVTNAPSAFHHGLAFATACSNGGIKIWRPRFPKIRDRQIEWSARNVLAPRYCLNGNDEHDPVSLSWSKDGSVILLAIGGQTMIVSAPTSGSFEVVKTLAGFAYAPILAQGIINSSLISVTENQLSVYDLLHDQISWTVDVGYSGIGSKSLFAIGQSTFAVAVNYATRESSVSGTSLALLSNVYVFSLETSTPIHIVQHHHPIAALHYSPIQNYEQYTFIDTDRLIYNLTGPRLSLSKGASLFSTQSNTTIDETSSHVQIPGVTAILHPVSGKFKLIDKDTTKQLEISSDLNGARPSVVIKPTAVEEVFQGPEYASGDFDSMFGKLLNIVGKKDRS